MPCFEFAERLGWVGWMYVQTEALRWLRVVVPPGLLPDMCREEQPCCMSAQPVRDGHRVASRLLSHFPLTLASALSGG